VAIVAGVDFGTLSVRVSILDSEKGRLGSAASEYPLHRRREDPDHATQSHADHLRALIEATRGAVAAAGIAGDQVEALAVDTTGSSVVPVDASLEPIDDYYLWCDHRAWREAEEITRRAHESGLPHIEWCGGAYFSEWGFAKVLHWLRHNPEKRERFYTAFDHCDLIAAVLCGIKDARQAPRSICAMGHKWMWVRSLGGFAPEEFWVSVDPLLAGLRSRLEGCYATSDRVAGRLSEEWAAKLGLKAGIPIPVGALDAHWDAVGAGCREGDVVNVIGTSTCIMAIGKNVGLIPGVSGVVEGSIHPSMTGVEAGLSAVGDIFDAIARRAGRSVAELSKPLETYRAGQTGLLRLTWDNGDRNVLAKPELSGVTFGWNLTHTAEDELFAAIEGTAFHTRLVLERMQEHGLPIERVINGGGIPQRNDVLNRVYGNVFGKPVLVPESEVTSLGSGIFAFLAAGAFESVEAAQDAVCPKYRVIQPEPAAARVYEELYGYWKRLYFGLGAGEPMTVGDVLPALRRIAAEQR
jgi:L-ribulokinase